MSIEFEVLPGVDLSLLKNWNEVSKNRYFAARVQLMTVKRELDEHRDGNVIGVPGLKCAIE